MSVVVTCRCGQRFAAEERLIGQQVPCPVCGSPLIIAEAPQPSIPAAHESGVRVDCGCGRAFLAPESLRGTQVTCPACGGILHVPAHSPPPAPAPLADPLSAAAANPLFIPAHVQDAGEVPWGTLRYLGALGIGGLVIVIVVTSILSFLRESRNVADVPPPPAPAAAPQSRAADSPAAAPLAAAPHSPQPAAPRAAPLPPPPPVESSAPAAGSAADRPAFGFGAPSAAPGKRPPPRGGSAGAATSSAAARLPDGVQAWHEQPGVKLAGIRRVGSGDTPAAHFSWMTSLLPFLGHGPTYEKFDFQQPVDKSVNLNVGRTLIPEFISPHDDRQRWKGYPFDGLALTHFAGMSGVEDARNVVAAKLPRSDPRAGVFGYDEVARPEEITDGLGQTIMVVGTGDLPNPWVFGGGATIRGAREPLFDTMSGLGTKGLPGGGTLAVMADGSVRHVAGNVDPRVFRALCTIHGAESVDLNASSQPHALENAKQPTSSTK
jgi:DNA-directed RNA polymerase subunit RPC12/RpoP